MHTSENRRILQSAALVLLSIAALVSLATGIRHAIQYGSHDLQWMGGRLLSLHVDPWQEKLTNYPHHFDRFSPPNYLYLLYLLFLPFSGLSFHAAEIGWCIASIGFSIAAVMLLGRCFRLSRYQTGLLLCLLWMSSPFRVVLEVGQMSLFELFFFCLAYIALSVWVAGAALGVSFVKYSFSPVAVVLLLLRGRVGRLGIAALVTGLGLFGVKMLVSTPLLQLAREPFLVSRIAVSPGIADLMTLVEYALKPMMAPGRAVTISYAVCLAGTVLYALVLRRYRLTRGAELTLVSLASLFFFKHLIYDYVFLAIPLAYALSLKASRGRNMILAGVGVFWFLATFLGRSIGDHTVYLPGLAVNVVLLLALLGYTTYVALGESSAAPSTARAARDREPERIAS